MSIDASNKSDKSTISTEYAAFGNDLFDPLVDYIPAVQLENTVTKNNNNDEASIDVTNKSNNNEISAEDVVLDNGNNVNASLM